MAISFPINFEKMSGSGNDFIVIDNRDSKIHLEDQPEFTRKICTRMFSVGGNGLIFIEKSDVADFSWQFYNGDGSIAEMCGNGARCAARFAYRNNIAKSKMKFETTAGTIQAEILEDDQTVRIQMTKPFDFRLGLSMGLNGKEHAVAFVNTGVPHAVIFVEEESTPVKKLGRKVRFHELFEPEGTNASFARVLDDGRLEVRTYERGIEDETMACGTGAVAAALFATMQRGMESPIEVVTAGGDVLKVRFDLLDGPVAENVFLEGPVRLIYKGQLTAEALL